MKPACTVCEVHAESVFRIDGMDCHEEVAILERRLKPLFGLEEMTADVIGRRLRVQYDAAKLSASAIADAVGQTGMRAWLEHEHPVGLVTHDTTRRQTLLAVCAACVGVLGVADYAGAPIVVQGALSIAAVAAGGLYPLTRALAALRARVLDINVLMIVAVIGALALGEWTEASAVIFLFSLAQALEARAMDRARGAIRGLMDLAPAEALVRRDGADVRVPVDDVPIGARLLVKPGQKVPLDGLVCAGESDVNQSPITGESLPVDKRVGDEVFAGTINGHGALEVQVTRLSRDTTLARVIHLVEAAQAQRAPSQTFVERFARIYTPAVLVLALLVAFGPPLVADGSFALWMYRALVLLVISCPCALVISTPVAIVSALAGAARMGVLIKGGVHLERAAVVRCLAFDKTGTLTKGQPAVVDVLPFDGASRADVLRVAASLDAHSTHPIAHAIVRRAREEAVSIAPASGVTALGGRGVSGLVNGTAALVGNRRLFAERALTSPALDAHLDAIAGTGQTAVIVAVADRPVGVIAVADELRETSPDTIALLREQGIAHVAILTGDYRGSAEAVAHAVQVDDCRAELLPQDKVDAIAALRAQHGAVAMIGDGVNDAPALAAADVGIAMGAAGSDAALETADIALMADELLKIPYAFRLSRATLATIRTNIAFSLAVKGLFLLMAIGGFATLWMAVLADTGASLLVIGNGLRLLRKN